ncbi:hypothetical protein R3Q06_32520 [Rhodococcus erythropolis]|uniref:hypothetical protein n=1 Tax=Rhodococcus erythropolis TaxID=1833 RepID=UPI0029494E34|nr:hypothetical protein [Rhodococcus erythropolis]MDV6278191.1 hypothetical protein [Rhodococcus erythropolis]
MKIEAERYDNGTTEIMIYGDERMGESGRRWAKESALVAQVAVLALTAFGYGWFKFDQGDTVEKFEKFAALSVSGGFDSPAGVTITVATEHAALALRIVRQVKREAAEVYAQATA